jgi:hypothetical protein
MTVFLILSIAVRKELSFVSDTEVLVLLERITKKFSHNS